MPTKNIQANHLYSRYCVPDSIVTNLIRIFPRQLVPTECDGGLTATYSLPLAGVPWMIVMQMPLAFPEVMSCHLCCPPCQKGAPFAVQLHHCKGINSFIAIQTREVRRGKQRRWERLCSFGWTQGQFTVLRGLTGLRGDCSNSHCRGKYQCRMVVREKFLARKWP